MWHSEDAPHRHHQSSKKTAFVCVMRLSTLRVAVPFKHHRTNSSASVNEASTASTLKSNQSRSTTTRRRRTKRIYNLHERDHRRTEIGQLPRTRVAQAVPAVAVALRIELAPAALKEVLESSLLLHPTPLRIAAPLQVQQNKVHPLRSKW